MTHESILTAADINGLTEDRFVHPFNAKAVRNTRSLGDLTGLTTLGFHLVRVAPGDETTQHHSHLYSDEYVYVLSGSCTLDLGDDSYPLGTGDFVGFPMGGLAHSMKNTGEDDLVYLMGGTRPEMDVADYPRINRRLYILGDSRESVEWTDLNPVEK